MAAPKLIDAQYDGPQRIDRYDLVAEIASGGMATVYLARLSGVGGFRRFVAIKRLHPHLAGEQEFVEMFLDEARLAAGIHHPNVVPILEVGASDRGYYLVMEYIEGDTLARLLARAATSGNRLPVAIGTRILVDMLAGLHAAHELRDEHGEPTELVHRDVSPQNVLVGMDGNTRITDFGVARAASRLSATRAGQLKGKIAYMAPEQATGDPSVDRRADVFSAGIVLWEVLAARRLFKAENEAATLSRVISEPITHIGQVNPDIGEELGAAVMKALARDRDDRFSNCADFADALEKAAVGAGQLAAARDVASYVSEVIGGEIAQQREAVRTWLARSEPSQATQDVLELPPRVSAPPPLPGGDQSQSGLIAAPLSASLGDSSSESGGRSRTPMVVAIAALLGFVLVGGAVTFFGGSEPTVVESGVAPEPGVELPAARADEPSVTNESETTGAATERPKSPSELAPVDDDAGEETKKAAAEPAPRAPRRYAPKPAAPRVVRPSAPAQPPAARTPAKPEPKPEPKPDPGVDLSNPYR